MCFFFIKIQFIKKKTDKIMKSLFSGFNKEQEPDPAIQIKTLIKKGKIEITTKEREFETLSNKAIIIYKQHSNKSRKEMERILDPILKQKKTLENEINSRRNAITLLEKSINLLDESKMNQQVVNALQNVNTHIKKTTNEVDIEKMTGIMDDFHETIQDVNEITTVLENPDNTNDNDLLTDFYGEIENMNNNNNNTNTIVIEEKNNYTEQNYIDLHNLPTVKDVIYPIVPQQNKKIPKDDVYAYLKNLDF